MRVNPRVIRDGAQVPNYPPLAHSVRLLFCLYVVAWYLQFSARVEALESIRFEFVLAAVLCVIAFFSLYSVRFEEREVRRLVRWALALFVVMLASVILSRVPSISGTIFVDRVLQFSVMALFVVAFVRSPLDLRWFIGAFMLACLRLGYEGFVGRLTGSLFWENQGVLRLHGPTPLYEHPNSFAGNALGGMPFAFLLIPLVPRWAKGLLLLDLVFAANVVLFTGSRTGYVAFIGLVLYAAFRAKRRARAILIVAILGAVLALAIPQQYLERAATIVTLQEKEGRSAETRMEILRDAWAIFLENPFGVGVAAFPAARLERFGRSQDTHNLYLEVATNLGLQGLVVFAGLLFALFGVLRSARSSLSAQVARLSSGDQNSATMAAHRHELQFCIATCTAVELFVVLRLLLGLFGMDLYEIYWWFAIGLAIAIRRLATKSEAITDFLTSSPNARPDESARLGSVVPMESVR